MRIYWLYVLLQILQRDSALLPTLFSPPNHQTLDSPPGVAGTLARRARRSKTCQSDSKNCARPLSKSVKGSMLLANQTRLEKLDAFDGGGRIAMSASQKETLTITDNRTGRQYEVPITDGTIRAMDLRQIKTDDAEDFGLMTYDPAFMNTASCKSTIKI